MRLLLQALLMTGSRLTPAPTPGCICSFSLLRPTADPFCSQGLVPQTIILITQGENFPLQLIDAIMEVINNRRTALVFFCRQEGL